MRIGLNSTKMRAYICHGQALIFFIWSFLCEKTKEHAVNHTSSPSANLLYPYFPKSSLYSLYIKPIKLFGSIITSYRGHLILNIFKKNCCHLFTNKVFSLGFLDLLPIRLQDIINFWKKISSSLNDVIELSSVIIWLSCLAYL